MKKQLPKNKYHDGQSVKHERDGILKVLFRSYNFTSGVWQYVCTNGLWYDEQHLSDAPLEQRILRIITEYSAEEAAAQISQLIIKAI